MKYIVIICTLYFSSFYSQAGIPLQYPILDFYHLDYSADKNEFVEKRTFKNYKMLEKDKGVLLSKAEWVDDSCLRETFYVYKSCKVKKIINRYYNSEQNITRYENIDMRKGGGRYSYVFDYHGDTLKSIVYKLQDFMVEKRTFHYFNHQLSDVKSVWFNIDGSENLYTNNLHFIYKDQFVSYILDNKLDTISSFKYENNSCIERIERAEGDTFVKFQYSYIGKALAKEIKFSTRNGIYKKDKITTYLNEYETIIQYFDGNEDMYMEVKKEKLENGKIITKKRGAEQTWSVYIIEEHHGK